MPIAYKTTKYGCAFKCGTRRRSTTEKAEMHEVICWNNPDNKTCKTCKNEIYYSDHNGDPDFGSREHWMVRDCKDEAASIMLDQEYDKLKNEGTDSIKPMFNCPFWESKDI